MSDTYRKDTQKSQYQNPTPENPISPASLGIYDSKAGKNAQKMCMTVP